MEGHLTDTEIESLRTMLLRRGRWNDPPNKPKLFGITFERAITIISITAFFLNYVFGAGRIASAYESDFKVVQSAVQSLPDTYLRKDVYESDVKAIQEMKLKVDIINTNLNRLIGAVQRQGIGIPEDK